MKMASSNSQQLRAQMQHLVEAREQLQSNADVSGSMVKTFRALNNIKPLLAKQSENIRNFLQPSENNDQSSKESENRRYTNRISEIAFSEFNQLLTAAEGYFTLQTRNSWNRVCNDFEEALKTQRKQGEKNTIEFLLRVMNFRDKIIKEFLKSMLYRKCLLWKDLNIASEGFVHAEKKRTTKSIQDLIITKGYAPTRPIFYTPSFQVSGQWQFTKSQAEEASIPEFLRLVNQQVQEVFSTVRNYSSLNEEQRAHEDIRRNSAQVLSLRQEIEQLHNNYQILEGKYREAVSKDEKLGMVEMKQKLKLAEEAVEAKDRQLKQLNKNNTQYNASMNKQKDKIKELQADLQKITDQEMKKLKQMQNLQISLAQEFARIHRNMSSFGPLFEFESNSKKSLAVQIINLKQKIEQMAIILGRHKNDNRTLKEEIKRLNIVIIELGLQLKERRDD